MTKQGNAGQAEAIELISLVNRLYMAMFFAPEGQEVSVICEHLKDKSDATAITALTGALVAAVRVMKEEDAAQNLNIKENI